MASKKAKEKINYTSISNDTSTNDAATTKGKNGADVECQKSDFSKNTPSVTSMQTSVSSFFERHVRKYKHCVGMVLAATSGLLMTLYSALYKMVKSEIDNSTVLMLRGIIQIVIMLAIILAQRTNVAPKGMAQKTTLQKMVIWISFICLCIIGGVRLCSIFAALERIPMALVHTILNGSPVMVMVLGHLFLNDSCSVLRTICTFGLVGGVILIFQPQNFILADFEEMSAAKNGSSFWSLSTNECDATNVTNDDVDETNVINVTTPMPEECHSVIQEKLLNDLIGYGFSVAALVLSAFGSVLTKKITQNFDKMVVALYLGMSIGIVGWLQMMIFEPMAPTSPDSFYPWFVAVIVGLLGVAQQFCLIAALKIESPTRVTVIRSLNIVVSFIVQIQAWNEHPGLDQIFGAVIVVVVICVVTLEDPITRSVKKCVAKRSRVNDDNEDDDDDAGQRSDVENIKKWTADVNKGNDVKNVNKDKDGVDVQQPS